MATVVTIGRNVGDDPMSQELWDAFVSRTVRAVRASCDAVYFVGHGRGIWEGQTEDSFTIVASDVSGRPREILRTRLASLARTFRQDGIALTVAPSDIVPAA